MALCHRILTLNADPHPGLATWNAQCVNTVRALYDELKKDFDPEPSVELWGVWCEIEAHSETPAYSGWFRTIRESGVDWTGTEEQARGTAGMLGGGFEYIPRPYPAAVVFPKRTSWNHVLEGND